MTQRIESFRINIPDADLDDLARRLTRTRWPDELPESGWNDGVPVAHIRELTEYWLDGYDWREHEAALNNIPQYTTVIDNQRIHFLHARSPQPGALPLLLIHGWPGSFLEFVDVLGLLSDPECHGASPGDAFHVVVASIPGFTFSSPVEQPGWAIERISCAFAELMRGLGYQRYGVQGGDWGSVIARTVAAVDPQRIVGVHLNYLPFMPPEDVDGLSPQDLARVEHARNYIANRPGYMVQQSTRPHTLAFGLTDSPVGQLAWIAEKFAEWTDPECPIQPDRLITNVMLYWLTGTAASSARIYRENAKAPTNLPTQCTAPVGVAVCPHELLLPVRKLAERSYTITQWTEFEHGGHFAAMEVPQLLTHDIRKFFRPLR